jgi:hypothetical protein
MRAHTIIENLSEALNASLKCTTVRPLVLAAQSTLFSDLFQYNGMNNSISSVTYHEIPPALLQISHDLFRVFVSLLIPAELLYFAIYFHVKGHKRLYSYLTWLSFLGFWICPVFAPTICGPSKSLQHCGSKFPASIWDVGC